MLTHIDGNNLPKMVDVGNKQISRRKAKARSVVFLPDVIGKHFQEGEITTKKGPVIQTAIIAGTMAVKKTHELIPFCHSLSIDSCKFDIQVQDQLMIIQCETSTHDRTGIEMEALCGVSVAALTVYDMCKALSHEIRIECTELLQKSGGKHDYCKST